MGTALIFRNLPSDTTFARSGLKNLSPWIVILSIALIDISCSGPSSIGGPAAQQSLQTPTYSTNVDILWVIDSSGNMSANQTNLSNQMSNLMNSLNQRGIGYQQSVTTMDMTANSDQGKFLASGGPAVLLPATANLLSLLDGRLTVGDYPWHPPTTGLQAMQTALMPPNSTGVNSGFIRPNSLLVINFVTINNDRSPASNYQGFLSQLKAPTSFGQMAWTANFIGVVTGDPNCQTGSWQSGTVGSAYVTLAQASGGQAVSICSNDLTASLNTVTQSILTLATAYPLNQIPDPTTLSVQVNGQTVAADPANGWTYVTASNTIQFHGSAIPSTGASFGITFVPEAN